MSKYPAHSTKPYRAPGARPVKMFIYGMTAFCLLVAPFGFAGFAYKLYRQQITDNAPITAEGSPIAAQQVATDTGQPTSTQTVTQTPTPTATFSPTPQLSPTVTPSEHVQKVSNNMYNTPQIEVTRLVSTTPEPSQTPYPTYTHVPTNTPTVSILAVKARHDYEMTMRREAALMSVFEFVTAPFFLGLVTVLLLILAGRAVWGSATTRVDNAIDEASGVTTREELEPQPYRDEIDALLNRSLELYGETQPTRLAGWREMEWHPEDWTAVKEHMKSIGFRIVTHNVGSSESPGTYLLAGNLHHWRNRWFLGLLR